MSDTFVMGLDIGSTEISRRTENPRDILKYPGDREKISTFFAK